MPLVLFYPDGHQAHAENGHPERPERVEAICQALKESGVWEAASCLKPIAMDPIFLSTVHSPSYIAWLPDYCQRGGRIDGDTYTTPGSWQAALTSAGGAVAVAQAVWQSPGVRGFALCRPPGHHAKRAIGMGFCLLNNIAIAAQFLLKPPEDLGANVQQSADARPAPSRLAIVDLDLHHGNGTQDIFWQRDDVLFISIHQSPLFPGTGRMEEIGAGAGKGFTVNLPMPPGTGDGGYQAAMDEVILPLLKRYQPEMILVSYGFDPHWRDPLGYLMLSASGYGRLVGQLVEFADGCCQGRIALFLEGGYDLQAAVACSQAVVAALLEVEFKDGLGPAPRLEGKSWQAVIRQARETWQV